MAGLDSCVFRFDMRLMRSTPMLHLFVALQLLILFYVQRLMLRTMESDEGEEQEGGKRKKNGSTLSDDQPVDALEAYATYRRYERVRVLGSGTQGIAMLCRDPSPDGEEVVFKEVRVAGLERRRLDCLRRELHVLQSLRHENIIEYRAAFQDGPSLYLVQEYAAGGTLAESIEERRNGAGGPMGSGPIIGFESSTVASLLHQLARGLQYMHQHRVLHRDLAPKNVFLSAAGNVKIGDFGLARELDASGALHASSGFSALNATSFCGTPFYTSPEMFAGRPYGGASDMWALGVIAFELLTLRLPFETDNMASLIHMVMSCEMSDDLLERCNHPQTLCRLASRHGLLHLSPSLRSKPSHVLQETQIFLPESAVEQRPPPPVSLPSPEGGTSGENTAAFSLQGTATKLPAGVYESWQVGETREPEGTESREASFTRRQAPLGEWQLGTSAPGEMESRDGARSSIVRRRSPLNPHHSA